MRLEATIRRLGRQRHGAGTISTSVLGLPCLAGSANHTVYGRIPAAQNVPSGAYADTITVTVTF